MRRLLAFRGVRETAAASSSLGPRSVDGNAVSSANCETLCMHP